MSTSIEPVRDGGGPTEEWRWRVPRATRALALRLGKTRRVELSILHFGHVGEAVDFMGEADNLGYVRFWLGEHHSDWQCTNPLLLGALLAATSGGIRIGSGGVCLDYQSPLRIAEDARLIEYMLPGRFDLGVTRGLKLEPEIRDAMLDGRPPETTRPYDEKLAELHGLLTGRLSPAHPLAGKQYLESAPPMWVLGTSARTARWAARHGTGFCFSLHHASEQGGAAIMDEYRRHFVPSPELAEPEAIVVASMVCAPTRAEALARREENGFVKVTITGSPGDCAAGLAATADHCGVDEVMILDLLPGHGAELSEKYRSLAQLSGLVPRAASYRPEPQYSSPA
jgi:alkanesulfonate monooxygenase SsuD/methylene tetrahydromethanopterin reductase-like flavin-dependent oxidoreductase (luciferase family)